MALMERVTTLLRANLNDLIDKAADPEKMLKQLVLDMENQLLQVKTQVAIAIADQHLLEKKTAEHETTAASWKNKAALAVAKGRDDMAREALERSLSHVQMGRNFLEQLEDQRSEAEALRSAFLKLQKKLAETRAHCELLIAEHRRNRAVGKSHQVRAAARRRKERCLHRPLQIAYQRPAGGKPGDRGTHGRRFAGGSFCDARTRSASGTASRRTEAEERANRLRGYKSRRFG